MLGVSSMVLAMGGLGAPVAGYIFDMTGSYRLALMLAIGVAVLMLVLVKVCVGVNVIVGVKVRVGV